MSKSIDRSALCARLDDLFEGADRGEPRVSDFLSPAELYFALKHIGAIGKSVMCFGGYEGAERQRIYALPEYLEDIQQISELEDYGFSSDIVALELITDGYRALSHRDYLGSLLGLGIERAVIGDVLVFGDRGESAIVFADKTISVYIKEQLERISSEKVRVRAIALCDVQVPERRFADISDTVASPRLDCIVAAVCSLSRERAREAVEDGLVELDFECEERADRAVNAPCMLSVRGYGRYKINSVNDKTKKGRYRLLAQKYL